MSLQAVKYAFNRFVLRREFLTAPAPDYALRLRVKTEDVVGRHIYKYGGHERETTDFLRANLRFENGDVVFDIGANIGWYTLVLSRIAAGRDVTICAFEPDPVNRKLLEDNVALNGADDVEIEACAVADESGTRTLHLYGDSNRGRHSLLPLHEGETLEIETVTLDDFRARRGLAARRAAFVKMDIEGYELMALRGAHGVLADCPLVMLEFSPRYMRAGGLDPAELVALMRSHGFSAHRLVQGRLTPADADRLARGEKHVDLFWSR